MFKRMIILGLVPPVVAIAASVLVASAGSSLLWQWLALKHPGDPSISSVFAWMLIYSAPLWIALIPMVGLVAGYLTLIILVRRLDGR
ncbi:MAG: hypothetical protein P4M07_23300 [Xanthobacteraceae bacterium]|jgi:hypothetical protein|nr:hypothetical protein [Xanthobacteraceae bacterium]